MKNPKVGERVAIYGSSQIGSVSSIADKPIYGEIIHIHMNPAGWVQVLLDASKKDYTFHEKQCRRLRPKKKPEVIKFETTWKSEFKSNHTTTSPTEHMVSVPYLEAKKFYGKRCKVTVEILGE